MFTEKFKNNKIILASKSPRRKLLLSTLNLDFEVKIKDTQEVFPPTLPSNQVAEYLAKLKMAPFLKGIKDEEIIITADTVVVCDEEIMGKPKDKEEAKAMLEKLSGRSHSVISGVAMASRSKSISFSDRTDVSFKVLKSKEIEYYIEKFNPLDKAGAYGIQEWVGHAGVLDIRGSYNNVMGLPTHLIYEELQKW